MDYWWRKTICKENGTREFIPVAFIRDHIEKGDYSLRDQPAVKERMPECTFEQLFAAELAPREETLKDIDLVHVSKTTDPFLWDRKYWLTVTLRGGVPADLIPVHYEKRQNLSPNSELAAVFRRLEELNEVYKRDYTNFAEKRNGTATHVGVWLLIIAAVFGLIILASFGTKTPTPPVERGRHFDGGEHPDYDTGGYKTRGL